MLLIELSDAGFYMSKYRSLWKGGANVTKASSWHPLAQTDSNWVRVMMQICCWLRKWC